MNSTDTTTVSSLPSTPKPQTSREVIQANVDLLIAQLEAGHSEALTSYLTAMGRFHNYSLGNILLDSEWDDIHAIVLQSQKQGLFSQWRAEESQAVVLGPDQFLPNLDAAAEIARWRGTSGTLSQWQRTLIGRIAQSCL